MVSHRDQILFIVFLLPYLVQPAGYHAVGSNVTLRTGYGGNDLVSVDWKQGDDLAVTMIEQAITPFRNFKGRIFLNLTNGDLTLIGVNVSDSGKYTVYLNGKDRNTKQHFIKVIRYHAVGSNVTLRTGYGGNDLVSVEWKQGDDLAVTLIKQNCSPKEGCWFDPRLLLAGCRGVPERGISP